MDYINKLHSIHLDILKEIGNIGAGHAAAALSALLNRAVDMKVPNVRVSSFDDMVELAGGSEREVVSISLRMEGDITGSMFFVLSLQQAETFTEKLLGQGKLSSDSESLRRSALQELGNILSGTYLSALADFTRLQVQPSVPELIIDMFGAIISYGLIEASRYGDKAIMIETILTELDEEEASETTGYFFLLPDPPAFRTIFQALGAE